MKKPKPKYKQGDHLRLVLGKEKYDNFIISGKPVWDNFKGDWAYPIRGKSNYSMESELKPYKSEIGREAKVKIKIERQGTPIIENAFIIEKSKSVIAIIVGFKSKYCNSGIAGDDKVPGICVEGSLDSLKLNKKYDYVEPTYILFPEYKGWEVFAVGYGKYSAKVCLIKK